MADRLQMKAEILELRTRHPFIIARGGRSEYRTVWVRLRDGDGNEGWGEAAPSRFYGETAETVLAALPHLRRARSRRIRSTSRRPSAAGRRSCATTPRPAPRSPPRCTIWSASGSGSRSTGCGGSIPPRRPRSTFTIGIDTPEKIRVKVKEAAEYPILKIKLGTDRDVEILRAIRETTDREIRVDANCGWTVKQAIADAPGAAGVRRDGAGAAASARQLEGWRRSPGGRRFR